MDLWTVFVLLLAVIAAVFIIQKFAPEGKMKQVAIWVVIGFFVIWMAIKFLAPILKGIRI